MSPTMSKESDQAFEVLGKRKRNPPDRMVPVDQSSLARVESGDEETSAEPARKKTRTPGKPRTSARRASGGPKDEPEYTTMFRTSLTRNLRRITLAYERAISGPEKVIEAMKLDLQRVNQKHAEEVAQYEDEIERMRVIGLERMAEMGFVGEPDDSIQANFSQLLSKVKSWVKAFGIATPAASLSEHTKAEVVKALTAAPNPSSSKSALDLAFRQKLSTTTVLNALFNKHVYNNMLYQTFFFLKGTKGFHSGSDLSAAAHDLFELGYQVNPDQAKVWLSQTMTLLHPQRSRSKDAPSQEYFNFQAAKQERYASCVESFLALPSVRPLLIETNSQQEKTRYDEALRIITNIGEHVLKIATQKVYMQALLYDGLKQCLKVTVDSGLARPHPSLKLEDVDRSWESAPVLLVVEPGVLAYGNEDGKNYEKYKIWHRAVVVYSNERPQPESSALQSLEGAAAEEGLSTAKIENSKHMVSKDSTTQTGSPGTNGETKTGVSSSPKNIYGSVMGSGICNYGGETVNIFNDKMTESRFEPQKIATEQQNAITSYVTTEQASETQLQSPYKPLDCAVKSVIGCIKHGTNESAFDSEKDFSEVMPTVARHIKPQSTAFKAVKMIQDNSLKCNASEKTKVSQQDHPVTCPCAQPVKEWDEDRSNSRSGNQQKVATTAAHRGSERDKLEKKMRTPESLPIPQKSLISPDTPAGTTHSVSSTGMIPRVTNGSDRTVSQVQPTARNSLDSRPPTVYLTAEYSRLGQVIAFIDSRSEQDKIARENKYTHGR